MEGYTEKGRSLGLNVDIQRFEKKYVSASLISFRALIFVLENNEKIIKQRG